MWLLSSVLIVSLVTRTCYCSKAVKSAELMEFLLSNSTSGIIPGLVVVINLFHDQINWAFNLSCSQLLNWHFNIYLYDKYNL